MRPILIKIGLAVIILGLATPSSAQLLIERSKVVETLSPGETLVGEVFLHNSSPDTPFSVKVYWEDFKYLPPFNGKKEFLPAGSTPGSLAKWANFSPQQFTLDPKTKQPINYSIQLPPDAKGGYYGVLFFERGDMQPSGQIGVNIIFRLGALFFIETVNKDKSAEITEVKIAESDILGLFSNLGDIILFPKGIYYILDGDGLVAERGELEKIYLPAGEKAEFKVSIPEALKAGDYTVVLTFDLDEGDSLVKEIDFNKAQGGRIEITGLRD